MTAPLLRPFVTGDEEGILALYRVVFKLDLSPAAWRWFFRGVAASVIVVAETEDGRIVGHYAVQPRPFRVAGRPVRAGLVIGSMVAPEFRNLATFVGLARAAYALCRAEGIGFVYAFPNDNVWLVRQRMLDWQALPPIHALAAAPSAVAVDAPALGERLALGAPFPAADWLASEGSAGVAGALSSEWLTWRFTAKPDADYPVYVHRVGGELGGYVALKVYRPAEGAPVGHVVDLRVRPGEEASVGSGLLLRAVNHFREIGVGWVSTWLLPTSPLHALAVGAGFSPEAAGKNFGYLALDEALDLRSGWDVRMGDSDVY